jgi:hexulose-6-phosphate isomerase
MLIGIMQGRLLPPEPGRFQAFPRTRWQQEFALAQAVGLQCIEWIYDDYGADVNPIATDEGALTLRRLSLENSVPIVSLCADYFIDHPSLDPSKLIWLFERCCLAGISRVVLPFVDNSRIESPAHAQRVISLLREVLPDSKIEIHLESSLDPKSFASLLDALPHPLLKANYDSGNSASLGYSPTEEFAAYGQRIGSVHIKDRVRHGSTVPLGTGAAEFPALFQALNKVNYRGDFILQTARGSPGEEPALAQRNLSWLQHQIAEL